MHMLLKILSRMVNSVEPDQTLFQEQSDLGLRCLHIYHFVRNFRTFALYIAVLDQIHEASLLSLIMFVVYLSSFLKNFWQ